MRTAWVMAAVLAWGLGVSAAPPPVKVEAGADTARLLAGPLTVAVAATGARATSLKAPADGGEWLPGGGLELHLVEQYTAEDSDYGKAKYRLETVEPGPARGAVQLTADGRQGNYTHCRVTKTLELAGDAPALRVAYRFDVGGGAVTMQYPSFLFVQQVPGDAEIVIPAEQEGLTAYTVAAAAPVVLAPAQGWVGVRRGTRGLVFVMPLADLKYIGARPADKHIKLVWRTVGYGLDPDQHADWATTVIAYDGLEGLHGAGELGCGEFLATGGARFLALAAGPAKLELAARPPNGAWAVVGQGQATLTAGLNTLPPVKDLAPGQQYRLRVTLGQQSVDLFRSTAGGPTALPLAAERVAGVDAPLAAGRDIDYKDFLPTPHVPWAKPLAGGKLKVFACWGELESNRLVNELMQRLDADIDTVTLATGLNVGWGLGGPLYGARTPQDITRALNQYFDARQYDVILLGGDFDYETLLGDALGAKVLDQVRRGAGLVYGNLTSVSKSFADALPLKRSFGAGGSGWTLKDPAYHYLTAGLPIAQMSSGIKKYIGVKPDAKLLVTAGVDGAGADATENPLLVTAACGQGRVVCLTGLAGGEEGQALLLKTLLWAAKRESPVRLDEVKVEKDAYAFGTAPRLRVRASAPPEAAQPCQIVIACDEWRTERALAFKDGKGELSVELPATLAAGRKRVSVFVNRDLARVNFGLALFTVQPPGALAIELDAAGDRPTYPHGTPIKGRCRPVTGFRTTLELVDAFGRVLDQQVPAADGAFALGTKQSARPLGHVYARIWQGERVVQELRRDVYITLPPAAKAWDEFELHVYGGGGGRGSQLLREAADPWFYGGLESDLKVICAVGVPYGIAHVDTGAWEALLMDYGRTKDPKLLHRVPCINSPQFKVMVEEMCRNRCAALAKLGTIAYINGDEQSMTSYTREFDFCFSPYCLAEFRKYVESKYGTIETLNQVWQTAYKSFAEATPPLTADVRKNEKLIPAWNDFRVFNNITFAKGYALIRDELRKVDPQARLGISGTQGAAAFGGHDYSRLMRVFDMLQEYGMMDEFQLAMNPGARLAPACGYSADHRALTSVIWRMLALGGAGVSYYNEASGILPTLRFASGMQGAVDGTRAARLDGLSKLVLAAEKQYDPIAVYYSHESINAGFIRYNNGGVWGQGMDWYRKVNGSTSFCPRFALRADVLAGLPGMKVAVFVAAYAVGDDELAALAKFLDAGGLVLADASFALTDFHARLRKDPAPVAKLRAHANFVALDSLKSMADVARCLREQAKLTPLSDVRAEGGALPGALVCTFRRGPLTLTSVFNGGGKPKALTLEYPVRWAVYDARRGKLLNSPPPPDEMGTFPLSATTPFTVPPNEAVFLAQLPYVVTGLTVAAAPKVARGQELAITAKLAVAGGAAAGDHVLALTATDPDGQAPLPARWRVTAPGGAATTVFFVPFNARPGAWQLQARDAATGAAQTVAFTVE